jgi:hypothetical protein
VIHRGGDPVSETSALDDFWDDKLEEETWVAYHAVGESLKRN